MSVTPRPAKSGAHAPRYIREINWSSPLSAGLELALNLSEGRDVVSGSALTRGGPDGPSTPGISVGLQGKAQTYELAQADRLDSGYVATDDFTSVTWLEPGPTMLSSGGSYLGQFGDGLGGRSAGIAFSLIDTGTITRGRIDTSGGQSNLDFAAGDRLSPGQTYCVVIARQGTDAYVQVNGRTVVTSSTIAAGSLVTGTGDDYRIGSENGAGTNVDASAIVSHSLLYSQYFDEDTARGFYNPRTRWDMFKAPRRTIILVPAPAAATAGLVIPRGFLPRTTPLTPGPQAAAARLSNHPIARGIIADWPSYQSVGLNNDDNVGDVLRSIGPYSATLTINSSDINNPGVASIPGASALFGDSTAFDFDNNLAGGGFELSTAETQGLPVLGDVSLTFAHWHYYTASSIANNPIIFTIMGNGETTATNIQILLEWNSSQNMRFGHEYGSGTNEFSSATTGVPPTDEWSHLALVKDAAAKTYTLYINGEEDTVFSYTNATTGGSDARLCWMGYFDDFDRAPNDEALYPTLWGRALAPQEVRSLYAQNTRWNRYQGGRQAPLIIDAAGDPAAGSAPLYFYHLRHHNLAA